MKRAILAFLAVIVILGFAIDTRADIVDGNAQRFRIVVLGMETHDDYDYVFDGVSRLNGVSDLTLARISNGSAVFTGYISTEEDMFTDDVQNLVGDRYSYKERDSDDVLEITLTKL